MIIEVHSISREIAEQKGAFAKFFDIHNEQYGGLSVFVIEAAGKELFEDLDSFFQSKDVAYRRLSYGDVFKSGLPHDVDGGIVVVQCVLEGDNQHNSANLAAKLGAREVTFWNSNSFLKVADLPNAKIIETLSFSEATEMSFFGAPIIKALNLLPASEAGIGVRLRNFSDLSNKGSLICKDGHGKDQVKGFSVIHNVSVINVEGPGMSGVPGVSSKLFTTLSKHGVSVILISQASSEYSICFCVSEEQTEQACQAAELALGEWVKVTSSKGCAIVAAVGDNMSGQVGISASFFTALSKCRINIMAIAQGMSERNISAVIKDEDSEKALKALYQVFFTSQISISMGLIGPGNIGSRLLGQLEKQKKILAERGISIKVRAISNSKKMALSNGEVDPENWKENSQDSDLESFAEHVNDKGFAASLIVDCSASEEVAQKYLAWMKEGINVVTPNKKAGTASFDYYRALKEESLASRVKYYYEATVGAGLPIICTLKDMVTTGDKITKIEGLLSGTLSWLFSNYDGTKPFSALVREAKSLGYTEPDPRDDLGGMDVARKTVILSREAGNCVELSDMAVESLVPEALRKVSKEEFMDRLEEMDSTIKALYDQASAKGLVLRYSGWVDEDGSCHTGLIGYEKEHPFAQSKGSGSVVCFYSERYNVQPLTVRGSGAGGEVTASGVFADILRLCLSLGARI